MFNYSYHLKMSKNKTKKIKCFVCREEYLYIGMVHFKDGNIREMCCKECAKKFMIFCFGCGCYIPKNKEKKVTGLDQTYCQECFEAIFTICKCCNKIYPKTSMKLGLEGKFYCKTCFNKRFAYCDKCHVVFWKDDLRFDEEDFAYYCADCWSKMKFVNEYAYQPKHKFFKCQKETIGIIFMGIELEVQSKVPIGVKAEAFMKYLNKINLKNHFYLKNDNSLEQVKGISGFEIVTHPFSLKYIKSFMRINEILYYLKKANFDASSSCGLHVHVEKKHLSGQDIDKLRLFISKYSNEVYLISGRKNPRNSFCIYENFDLLCNEFKPQQGRHCAFNINTNKNTVEFRMFASTFKYEYFLASIEFANALVCFIKKVSFDDVLNPSKKNYDKTWKEFLTVVKDNNNYINLYNLMKEKKLCV